MAAICSASYRPGGTWHEQDAAPVPRPIASWRIIALRLPLVGDIIVGDGRDVVADGESSCRRGVGHRHAGSRQDRIHECPFLDATSRIANKITTGAPLGLFGNEKVFLIALSQLMAVGERTGNMDEMLSRSPNGGGNSRSSTACRPSRTADDRLRRPDDRPDGRPLPADLRPETPSDDRPDRRPVATPDGPQLPILLPKAMLSAALSDLGGIDSRSMPARQLHQASPVQGDPDLAERMVLSIPMAGSAMYGQWSWPRQEQVLLQYGRRTLVIGVYPDAGTDRFNAVAIESLGDFPAGALSDRLPDGDALLGEMLSYTPSVMAVSLISGDSANAPYLPASVSVIGESRLPLMEGSGLLSPVEKVAQAPGAGFVSLAFERDSTVRRIPMVARFDGQLLPSLSAEMLRVAQGAGGHILKQAIDTGTGVNRLRTGQVTMTLDSQGRLPLYHGTIDRFVTMPASDVLNEVGLERLAGAFVIIGSSATGLKDTHSTNLEAAIPGPMIHLGALHQILSGVTLRFAAL